MRALIIAHDFPPTHFGGMAQHAWHLAHHLSTRHEILVLVHRLNKRTCYDAPFRVSPTLSIRFPKLDVMAILSAARTFDPDIVHVCNAALSYRQVSGRYPTVTRVVGNDFLRPWCGYRLPLSTILYRLPWNEMKKRLKKQETAIRKKKTLRRLSQVSAVVANSQWTKTQLLAEGIPESIVHTVVGGVDTKLFKPTSNRQETRHILGLSDTDQVIVTAANLVMKKGIDTVLRVVAKLVPKWPDLRYVIVGDGPCEKYLRELAGDLGIRGRVDFVGRKNQAELCRYYQTTDIYVQVSRNHRLESGYLDVETMGRTYMEASACGIPVVAASVGGVPSVVKHGENGLLVTDPLDVDAVAATIDQLLGNADLRHRLGETGARVAREWLSWEAVTGAFEEILIKAARHSGVKQCR